MRLLVVSSLIVAGCSTVPPAPDEPAPVVTPLSRTSVVGFGFGDSATDATGDDSTVSTAGVSFTYFSAGACTPLDYFSEPRVADSGYCVFGTFRFRTAAVEETPVRIDGVVHVINPLSSYGRASASTSSVSIRVEDDTFLVTAAFDLVVVTDAGSQETARLEFKDLKVSRRPNILFAWRLSKDFLDHHPELESWRPDLEDYVEAQRRRRRLKRFGEPSVASEPPP